MRASGSSRAPHKSIFMDTSSHLVLANEKFGGFGGKSKLRHHTLPPRRPISIGNYGAYILIAEAHVIAPRALGSGGSDSNRHNYQDKKQQRQQGAGMLQSIRLHRAHPARIIRDAGQQRVTYQTESGGRKRVNIRRCGIRPAHFILAQNACKSPADRQVKRVAEYNCISADAAPRRSGGDAASVRRRASWGQHASASPRRRINMSVRTGVDFCAHTSFRTTRN